MVKVNSPEILTGFEKDAVKEYSNWKTKASTKK